MGSHWICTMTVCTGPLFFVFTIKLIIVANRAEAGLWGTGDYTLYRLGWDVCILAVIGRWLLCSGGCFTVP